jgi:hypothetical protein
MAESRGILFLQIFYKGRAKGEHALQPVDRYAAKAFSPG